MKWKQSMKRRTTLFIAIVVLVGLAVGGWLWWRGQAPAETWREYQVKRGGVEVTIVSTGTVSPKNRLEIKPPLAGRAEEVLVNEGARVRKGQVLAWISSTERAALLDAARAKGEAEVRRWEEFYRATPIVAPINGTVILRNVEPGQTFTNVDAVLVIADRLIVEAQVDETDIAQITLKQAARIVLDAYADTPIPAQVDALAYEAKMVNNVTTYTVDVQPQHVPPFMRSGMTANVYFVVARKEDALVLPTSAVRKRRDENYVMVRGENGRPVEQSVDTGLSDGKHIEIVNGLKEGQTVLVAQAKSRERGNGGANPFASFGRRRR